MKNLFTSKLLYLGVAIIFIAPGFYKMLPVRIDFTKDSSLEYKVWITTAKFNERKHEYVMFKPKKTSYTAKVNSLVKKIGCFPGQYLSVNDLNYYCDGVFLGKAKEKDSSGNTVKPFKFDAKIPNGKLFVIGTHEKSYDSRYFGFVDIKDVKRGATPWEKL